MAKKKQVMKKRATSSKPQVTGPTPLAGLFDAIKPASGPFGDTALKQIQQHLYSGPLEERTEYTLGEFNAIVMLFVLAYYYKSEVAKAILKGISQCRISLERKGRMEDVQAMVTEIQRQLEQQKLEVSKLQAMTGERR